MNCQFYIFIKFQRMYKSPQQRFYRTKPIYHSPTVAPAKQSPPQKYCSPKNQQKIKESQQSMALRSPIFEDSKYEGNAKVENKIMNLQHMLEYQKNKRQSQFSELFKMINSLKQGKRNSEAEQEPSFSYNQQQFPMTPRVRSKQNDLLKSPRQQNYQTFTPVYETISKAKQSRSKYSYQEDDSFFQRSFQDFSFKSLQLLLQKIQRESEFNNRNILRMQQELLSIRSALSNSKIRTGVPIEVQKFVRDSYKSLKSQLQAERNTTNSLILNQVEDLIHSKFKQFKPYKNEDTQIKFQEMRDSMKSMEDFLVAQIKSIDQKTSNQVFTVNEIIQQKFVFFKESLLDQLMRDEKESTQNIMSQIQFQKIKINQIQQSNASFYQQLEQTIASIQDKFKSIKTGNLTEKQNKQSSKIQQLVARLIEKSQISTTKLIKQTQYLLKGQIQSVKNKVESLAMQIQKFEELIIKGPRQKLLKHHSLNQNSSTSPGGMSQRGLNNKQSLYEKIDADLEEAALLYRIESEDESERQQKILQLISENCTFLQSRNCAIQESMSQVVWVINDIVEKLKHMM